MNPGFVNMHAVSVCFSREPAPGSREGPPTAEMLLAQQALGGGGKEAPVGQPWDSHPWDQLARALQY